MADQSETLADDSQQISLTAGFRELHPATLHEDQQHGSDVPPEPGDHSCGDLGLGLADRPALT
jgi:hypothetical protein